MISREVIQEQVDAFWKDIEHLSRTRKDSINSALDFFEIIDKNIVKSYFQKLPRRISLEIADSIVFVFNNHYEYDFIVECMHDNLEKKLSSLSIEKKIAAALWLTRSYDMTSDIIKTERKYDPEKLTWLTIIRATSDHSGSYPVAVN